VGSDRPRTPPNNSWMQQIIHWYTIRMFIIVPANQRFPWISKSPFNYFNGGARPAFMREGNFSPPVDITDSVPFRLCLVR